MTRLGSLTCPYCGNWHRSSEMCTCEASQEARMKWISDAIDRNENRQKYEAEHKAKILAALSDYLYWNYDPTPNKDPMRNAEKLYDFLIKQGWTIPR